MISFLTHFFPSSSEQQTATRSEIVQDANSAACSQSSLTQAVIDDEATFSGHWTEEIAELRAIRKGQRG